MNPSSSPRSANGERLAELGAVPSIGTVGDSFDHALAESVNGRYKTELIYRPGQGPWKTVEDVELATLGWVHWQNTERLHGYLGDVPPAEFETAFYAAQPATPTGVGIQWPEPSSNPVRFTVQVEPTTGGHCCIGARSRATVRVAG